MLLVVRYFYYHANVCGTPCNQSVLNLISGKKFLDDDIGHILLMRLVRHLIPFWSRDRIVVHHWSIGRRLGRFFSPSKPYLRTCPFLKLSPSICWVWFLKKKVKKGKKWSFFLDVSVHIRQDKRCWRQVFLFPLFLSFSSLWRSILERRWKSFYWLLAPDWRFSRGSAICRFVARAFALARLTRKCCEDELLSQFGKVVERNGALRLGMVRAICRDPLTICPRPTRKAVTK